MIYSYGRIVTIRRSLFNLYESIITKTIILPEKGKFFLFFAKQNSNTYTCYPNTAEYY